MESRSAAAHANPAGKHQSLPALTALRFFAALLVFGYHATENGARVPPGSRFGALLTQGFTGVPLFFVLSGFVLAYNYPVVASRRQFYLARIARVYPLCLFAVLVTAPSAIHFALYRVHDPGRLWALPACVVLLQAWFPGRIAFAANPPAWTLSVEALFYLLFPLLIPAGVRAARRPILWIALLWALFMVPGLLIDFRIPVFGWTPPPAAFQWYYDHSTLPPVFLGEFLMGAIAGARFRAHPRRIPGWIAAAAGLLALCAVLYSAHLPYVVVRNDLMGLPFVLLVYALAGCRSSVLASSPLQLGGEISYSMYLLQNGVLDLMRFVPVVHDAWWAVLPVLCGLSFLSYIGVEKPARRWVLHRFGVPAAPKPLPTPSRIP